VGAGDDSCEEALSKLGYETSSAGLDVAGAPKAKEGSFFSAGLGDGGAAELAAAPKLKAEGEGLDTVSSFFSVAAPKLNADVGAGEAGVAVEVPKLKDGVETGEDGAAGEFPKPKEDVAAGAGEAAEPPKLKAGIGPLAGASSFFVVEAPNPPNDEALGWLDEGAVAVVVAPKLKADEVAGAGEAAEPPKLKAGAGALASFLPRTKSSIFLWTAAGSAERSSPPRSAS